MKHDNDAGMSRCCCGGNGRNGCGGCDCRCGVKYTVIDSFVWPPWPEKDEKSPAAKECDGD